MSGAVILPGTDDLFFASADEVAFYISTSRSSELVQSNNKELNILIESSFTPELLGKGKSYFKATSFLLWNQNEQKK